ncbi:MAG TPA: mechanosensitive ion channel domain-containing protein [Cryomorphaceae bacterium]|nr:mechanosensitive ion channel domain-containing protein [Cryomorphaceae bacterium]
MKETETNFAEFIEVWLHQNLGVQEGMTQPIKMGILLIAMLVIAGLFWMIGQMIINRILDRLIKRTATDWDDVLQEEGAFTKTGHIIPAIVISALSPVVFTDYPELIPYVEKITGAFVAITIIRLITSVVSAANILLSRSEKFKDKPIASFTQLSKILIWFIGIVIVFSIVIGKNPIYLFSALGAVSAVLILVFKDTLLGFTASIQITLNDMVRIGDWVSVPKYGADGDVLEINLTTVKVRNWDKTISTVPTYSFVSDSFKNWRGMEESGGRRIKRAIKIKMSTVRFCDQELLDSLRNIKYIERHINEKLSEIETFNKSNEFDQTRSPVNGRRLTNIGIFRAYTLSYLKSNPNVHQDMTLLVRQLDPTETGIPIEIYCFSKDQRWAFYEGIQADIFDHLMASIKAFDLELFESPAGTDFQKLTNN